MDDGQREGERQLTVKAHVPRRIHSEIQKQCVLRDHALEWAIENILDGFVDVWRCSLRSIYDLHRIRTDSDNRWRVIVRFRTSICLAEDRSSRQGETTITTLGLIDQRHAYSFSTDTSEIRMFSTGTSGQKIRSTSITDQITIRTWTKRCEGLLGEREHLGHYRVPLMFWCVLRWRWVVVRRSCVPTRRRRVRAGRRRMDGLTPLRIRMETGGGR